jgi:glycosyltransferase involved in cell wall biosynthesis
MKRKRSKRSETPETELRVALFTDTFTEINGAAHTLRKVAEALRERDIPLDIYTYGESESVESNGSVRVFTFDHRVSRTYYEDLRFEVMPDFRVGERWRKSVAEGGYTVVHLATPGSMGLIGRTLARRSNLPMVGTYHTHLAEYGALRTAKPLKNFMRQCGWDFLRWFYRPCSIVLSPTQGVNQDLIEHHFANELGVFTRGIDVKLFSDRKRRRQDSEVVCAYVGRLAPEKNVRQLPEIVNGLSVPLWVIGDGPERTWLETELAKAKFTGYLHGEDLAQTYADSDVLLFPSVTDTFGNVVLEAMASGVVPVVSNGPGPKDFVNHGVDAFVCDGPRAMKDAVRKLVEYPELRLNMKRSARAFAERRDWRAAVEQLIQHYRAAVVR